MCANVINSRLHVSLKTIIHHSGGVKEIHHLGAITLEPNVRINHPIVVD